MFVLFKLCGGKESKHTIQGQGWHVQCSVGVAHLWGRGVACPGGWHICGGELTLVLTWLMSSSEGVGVKQRSS